MVETPTSTDELILLTEKLLGFAGPFQGEIDFLKRGVWTKDEATGQVLQFPTGTNPERFAYLEEIVKERQDAAAMGEMIFVVEKSRRMMMTWLFLALYLYDTLARQNHANFVGSRKMETSAFLLGDERMMFIYNHIPTTLWKDKPELLARVKFGGGYTRLECPQTGSYLQAIASGADQLRQYTASNVLLDEAAFFDKGNETWGATRPTIEGGGRVDLVSTANLGSWLFDMIYPEGVVTWRG
jgi:hypothetical protein